MAASRVGTPTTYDSTATSASHTIAHTAPNGVSNPALFVWILRRAADDLVTGVTYNGVALTEIVQHTRAARASLELWVLAGSSCPNDGSSHNIVVSCGSMELGVCAQNWQDVHATTPVPGSAVGDINSTTITTNITTTEDDEVLFDAVIAYASTGTFSPTSPQTEVVESIFTRGATDLPWAVSEKAGPNPAGSTSMGWTHTVTDDLTHIVARVRTATASGPQQISATLEGTSADSGAINAKQPVSATLEGTSADSGTLIDATGPQLKYPDVVDSAGGYTTDTGSSANADLLAALADGKDGTRDDATYIRSIEMPAGTANQEFASTMESVVSALGNMLRYTYGKSAALGQRIDQKVELYSPDGGTLITSWTHNDVGAFPILAEQDVSAFTLSGAHKVRLITIAPLG